MIRSSLLAAALFCMPPDAMAQTSRAVTLEADDGTRIVIAELTTDDTGAYRMEMHADAFSEYFLSMRPFKCIDGARKTWCHVPYPYENARNISQDLTDLEYDLLFVWKGTTDYGINMWNGIYYRLTPTEHGFDGTLHEIDMGLLAVPPAPGVLRPLRDQDIVESDPEGHWLPRLVIE
ncbi:hypothetical protein KDD17_01470 [Sulfitobacter albidus]|uniref:Uncharacterized protein n=1 Tax=Sulfitobacter albidus TaxID=2829501 RepID=A0A975PMT7_9RHOB|nr:hypothetical protein [Sulfitobacter albidus]QUJ76761.1 hypothetical protein KDD17_01470 [Sulfitobacter albidus]